VAHDFNNLLAIICGNAELMLMDGDRLSTHGHDFLGQINLAAERAANLTRQLLLFSRQQVMQSQPVALNTLIANLTKMLKRVIREDIRMECVYEEQLPFVQADPGMIEQALLNLVINARDAMPRGGELRISTRRVELAAADIRTRTEARQGQFVCLSIADTGSGIAPEVLPRIFEPFFTTKAVGKGTGLGLATVYGIMQQHNGWAEVASTVGQGTTFELFLPVIPTPDPTAMPAAAEAGQREGTETILLVEDEYSVRTITRRILESHGYDVHEAASGREALETWHRHADAVSLLVTDMIMPDGVSGRELGEQLQARKPGLKVVFISGYSADMLGADTEFVRRSGGHFLCKPCSPDDLLRTVRRCLDEP
jgi:two-component system, cell cycle sensor histidine kinase and response regulator CckA